MLYFLGLLMGGMYENIKEYFSSRHMSVRKFSQAMEKGFHPITIGLITGFAMFTFACLFDFVSFINGWQGSDPVVMNVAVMPPTTTLLYNLFLGAGVYVVQEEVLFRRIMYHGVRDMMAKWLTGRTLLLIAGGINCLVFAAMHLPLSPLAFVTVLLNTSLLVYLYEKHGLVAPIVAHGLANSFMYLFALL